MAQVHVRRIDAAAEHTLEQDEQRREDRPQASCMAAKLPGCARARGAGPAAPAAGARPPRPSWRRAAAASAAEQQLARPCARRSSPPTARCEGQPQHRRAAEDHRDDGQRDPPLAARRARGGAGIEQRAGEEQHRQGDAPQSPSATTVRRSRSPLGREDRGSRSRRRAAACRQAPRSTNVIAGRGGCAAPVSCRRSETGPRAVGITYSLAVSSMDDGGAGVRTCSTATAPRRARSDAAPQSAAGRRGAGRAATA